MELAATELKKDERVPTLQDYLYLLFVASGVTWLANAAAESLPEIGPLASEGTCAFCASRRLA